MGHEQAALPPAFNDPPIIPTTDSGRNLEAALPAAAEMDPADSLRRAAALEMPRNGNSMQRNALEGQTPLDEPSGELTPLPFLPVADATLAVSRYYPDYSAQKAVEIDAKFQHLLTTVHANRPGDDLGVVREAWKFCMQQHTGQMRASGEPYIIHPLEVSQILAEMKMDSTAIAAGLLHDAVEDTPVSTPEISRRFGPQVAHIVEGVTKLDRIKFANKEDHQAENIRKMLLAMVSDIRVVLIKMADRLHNMRTLDALKPEKQVRIARETLDIYAPLAHRLGMGKLRGEFEDLAFRYVDPLAYNELAEKVEELRTSGETFLGEIAERLETELVRHGLPGRVEHRIKRLYSIQQKLTSSQAPLEQVYDLYAVRIITNTVQDCYLIFGLVQGMWRSVPGRFKDHIGMPRPNGYQSLHTTLIASGGHQFEVQIRTEEMHRVAEDGIAAHWKYKANETVSARDEERLAWVRQLMEWQREMTDPNEFMSTLKIDLYPEEVYTFTPKGKVVVLPKDATPVDFAYTIHTELGHQTTGATVNGRIVPLRHRLNNGDIVEISKQAGHTPSRDWLTFVKSSRARNKIKHWLNEHQRERAAEIGRKLLEREARKFKASITRLAPADYSRVAAEWGLGGIHGTETDLLAAIGFGKYSARQALNRLIPGSTAQISAEGDSPPEIGKDKHGPTSTDLVNLPEAVRKVYFSKGSEALQVEGQGDLLVYRARCCNPIRGEEIVGYVTRGKGVAVHARSCPNVQNLLYEADRRIDVAWAPTPDEIARQQLEQASKDARNRYEIASTDTADAVQNSTTAFSAVSNNGSKTGLAAHYKPTRFPVRVVITCDDRSGMLKELTAVISDDDTNIKSVDSRSNPDGTSATVEFVIETLDLRHLTRLTTHLRRVPGVREVHRVSKL